MEPTRFGHRHSHSCAGHEANQENRDKGGHIMAAEPHKWCDLDCYAVTRLWLTGNRFVTLNAGVIVEH
ncbi:hypothetical protein BSKO_09502 [Bryopsis sp. KO-2023]|nr:hypothetical protein BSKO_09502 [Bryopsis sp. KO-2023]